MTTTHLNPDHASVKSLGMVVRDPSGRIGIIVGTRYNGETRICRVVYNLGTPLTQWHPGVDLVQASEQSALAAGYETTPTRRKKAVRYDW